MMKKRVLLFLFFMTAMVQALPAAASVPCAQPEEMQAIRIRALQTELMLAGLSCNGRQHYNHFVRSFRSELKTYATALRSYFHRAYGKSGENEMNQFITRLANESSTRSVHGADVFCSNAREWFSTVEQQKNLRNVAFTYRGDIRECRR